MSEINAGIETVKMKLSATCPSHSRADVSVGDHEIVIDEPESRGGTNLGAAPVQTFMASLIGCTNVITNKCANDLGIKIESMNIEMVTNKISEILIPIFYHTNNMIH